MHYLWCTRTWGITYSKDEKAEPNTTQIYANAIHPLDPNKEQGFTVFADASYADSPTPLDETKFEYFRSILMKDIKEKPVKSL